jgi:hypothetical protein
MQLDTNQEDLEAFTNEWENIADQNNQKITSEIKQVGA